MLTVLDFQINFTVSYGDIQMTTYILTFLFTWSALRIWREDFSLSSMATVVDLSKGNTYHIVQCPDVYAIISVAFCKV